MLPKTPFYYYDTRLLQQTLDVIKQEVTQYPHFHVHYALKANANPKLLRLIQQAGLGVDCVSGGEVQVGIDNGFDASKIVYAGVGKSDEEILLALHHGIFCFNVESIPELEVINELAQQVGKVANVCLRINPDVEAHTHANIVTGKAENKFGIALGDMLHVIELANSLSHIQFLGLHFHIGSQITNMQDYLDLCERVNDIQDHLNEEGIYPSVINVGGGLGIDYHDPDKHPIPDFQTYFNIFANNLRLREGQSVHFELGRSVVAQCGTLIARVLYVKQAATKQFAIIDAGMTELIRPALYQAHHQVQNISCQSTDYQVYDVVGPICESSDVFDKDILLPPTKRGDVIAIRSAGAYGETMASTYNCRSLPVSYTSEDFPLPITYSLSPFASNMSTLFLHTPANKRLVWYLAAEEYVAKHIDRLLPSADHEGILFVWIVDPTVIIGRHQVLQNEVNTAFCQEHNIAVYRRKSGGGCVYADAGNLMVSYIARSTHSELVFQDYLDRMSDFLRHMGYDAVKSTHNDIMIGPYKVSGNACFAMPNATIVHGTLLYNVDYSVLQQAITPSVEKLAKHGVESVRQRVINIRDIEDTCIESTTALAEAVQQYWCKEICSLSEDDMHQIDAIEQEYLDPAFILSR